MNPTECGKQYEVIAPKKWLAGAIHHSATQLKRKSRMNTTEKSERDI
jgi:hypothetical protein